MSPTCGTCWREFGNVYDRQQHMSAKGHRPPRHECDTCDRYFGSFNAVQQHMDALGHWYTSSSEDEWDFCCQDSDCDEGFGTYDEQVAHEIEEHWLCSECDRYFYSFGAIQKHRASWMHNERQLLCVCGAEYIDAAGVISHLEEGHCPVAQFTRESLYDLLLEVDLDCDFTNETLDPELKMQRRHRRTRNGWWECCLCRREFSHWDNLNQHVESPFHQPRIYHCPHDGECQRDFTTLAGLFGHMQDGQCGYMGYDTVQEKMENFLKVFKATRKR